MNPLPIEKFVRTVVLRERSAAVYMHHRFYAGASARLAGYPRRRSTATRSTSDSVPDDDLGLSLCTFGVLIIALEGERISSDDLYKRNSRRIREVHAMFSWVTTRHMLWPIKVRGKL